MGGESLPIAASLDDDLVSGIGEAVQGAVAQDGIVEETKPFTHGLVAGDDEAGYPVPVEDQLADLKSTRSRPAPFVRGAIILEENPSSPPQAS